MNSKRGGAIAEAAIVFPVVILVLMTVIYILIAMYTDASESAKNHMALRMESGSRTETVERANGFVPVMPDDRFGRLPFQQQADISERIRFPDRILFTDSSRVYVIDEVSYIRRVDLYEKAIE